MKYSVPARVFLALVILAGAGVFVEAGLRSPEIHLVRFVSFLLVGCLAARLKVKLPGFTGTMSVNSPFILVAAAEMNTLEALLVGCASNFLQCLPRDRRKFSLVQVTFNFCTMALAIAATRLIYGSGFATSYVGSPSLRLALATAGFFLANSVPVAIIISLTERKSVWGTWLGISQLSYPYFLASAGVAGGVLTLVSRVGWQVPLGILPLMIGVFYSYRRFFSPSAKALADAPGRIAPSGVKSDEKSMHA
jgi:hypothetical protein